MCVAYSNLFFILIFVFSLFQFFVQGQFCFGILNQKRSFIVEAEEERTNSCFKATKRQTSLLHLCVMLALWFGLVSEFPTRLGYVLIRLASFAVFIAFV